ncbi:MAG TPA: aldehyde dehydrogenase family protein, partial [Candidatus Dormibacteraeota bacterium]
MPEVSSVADIQIAGQGTVVSDALQRGGVVERGLLIGGESVPASSGKLTNDVSPWDGQTYARVAAGTPEDVTRAVDAAEAAFDTWSKMGAFERRAIFLRAADVMAERGEKAIAALAGDRSVPPVLGVQRGVVHPGAARGCVGDYAADRRAAADFDPWCLLDGPASPLRGGGGDFTVERAAGPRHP